MTTLKYIEQDLRKQQQRRTTQKAIAPLLGAICLLAFAPFNLWFISIIMLAALLYCWHDASAKHALITGLLFGIGLFGTGISWVFISLHRFGGAPIWFSMLATALLVLIQAAYYAASGYALRRYFNRSMTLTCLCAFPAIITTSEWLRSKLFSGFPWLELGYSQTNSVLAAFAPVLGVHGVTLITALLSGCIILLAKSPTKFDKYLAIACLTVIGLLSAGFHHEDWTTFAQQQSVAIVQGNVPQQEKWQANAVQNIIEKYLQLSHDSWQHDLIVWPEAAIPTVPQQVKLVLAGLTEKAIQTHSTFITGIPLYNQATQQFFNGAIMLGQYHGHYEKTHLVPFGEYFPWQKQLNWLYSFVDIPQSNFTPGAPNQPVFNAGKLKIATFICYEIAFPSEVLPRVKQASLVLVLSDDTWFGDSLAGWQHLQIAAMRALETGRYLVFASNSGPSAIISPQGTIIKRTSKNLATTLTGYIRPAYGATPYILLGNHLIGIILCVLLLLVLLTKKEDTLVKRYHLDEN